MKTNNNVTKKSFKGIEAAGLVIIGCFVVAICIYHFVFGNPANFMNNDPNNHPLPGNLLGTIYKGGIIVPIIQTLLLTVLALSVERFFTIRAAFGRGKLVKFVAQIKEALTRGDLDAAQALCDKQRGSVANVVGSTLRKYREMEQATDLTKDQKILAIQKELEEATALELPMMQQNLPIIATITTLGTLMGLLGTVIGMIKSFAALSAGIRSCRIVYPCLPVRIRVSRTLRARRVPLKKGCMDPCFGSFVCCPSR